ncbi:secretory lipase [Saccharothrix saharensis]|uniref:Secretory lipase n=1 Tax=Saccharothrix saharensis TaxID=571190 RepID=A0A543JMK8_9PSEU|nr:secretory lipase [Saccharothrix saharensis]
MRKIFSLSAVGVVLAAAVTALGPSAAANDSFYVPPSPLPAGAPGDLIRYRASQAGALGSTVRAWQVMYRSTDALGQPNAVTGTVLVPGSVDPGTAPVVAFAVGTHGPAFRCAPSEMVRIGALYEQPAVNDLLRAGYAVAITDYEGYRPDPRTTYVTGRSEGHAVIDVVRAAQRLPEARLSRDAKVVFRGYSQGGGAAMWAGQSQPRYAPELNLVGVVGGGVPADLVQVALPLDGRKGFGLLAYSLIGLDNAYPELDLEDYLNDAGRAEFARMRREACTLELLVDYRGRRLADYTTSSPVLTPPWLARVAENKLGGTAIRVPVHAYHATGDDLVDFAQAKALRDAYCGLGVRVDWRTYATDHITAVHTGSAAAQAFTADRIAGRPATSNC